MAGARRIVRPDTSGIDESSAKRTRPLARLTVTLPKETPWGSYAATAIGGASSGEVELNHSSSCLCSGCIAAMLCSIRALTS